MKNIIPYLCFLLFLNSCNSWLSLDDQLSKPKENYLEDNLKLNGYFYYIHEFDSSDLEIIFIYYDGCIMKTPTIDTSMLESYENKFINGDFYRESAEYKDSWGIFYVINDEITFESWICHDFRCWVYTESGEILNDSTFILKERYRQNDEDQTASKEINKIFHFKEFTPKPDSTNNYIK